MARERPLYLWGCGVNPGRVAEIVDELNRAVEGEPLLPAAGDLGMAVLYLRIYLRRCAEGIGNPE